MWKLPKRRVKRFRVHRGEHHTALLESRRRTWLVWWAFLVPAMCAMWYLQKHVGFGMNDFIWVTLAVCGLIVLPLAVPALFILPFHFLLRVDERDRTLVCQRRYFILPYRTLRVSLREGRLADGHTTIVEKIEEDVAVPGGLGCLLHFLGPVGTLIALCRAIHRRVKSGPQTFERPVLTLRWIADEGGEAIDLLCVEDEAELHRVMLILEDRHPRAVRSTYARSDAVVHSLD